MKSGVVGIVGAGLTGLALAHELARRGVPHVVLEADDRPGGVIQSGRVEDRVVEWGPQRARLTAAFERLLDELGLRERLLFAPAGLPVCVYAAGRLRRVPLSPGAFLRTDLLSWPAKLRLALEPLTAGPRSEERVAAFFTRKLGRQAYERLAGPLYGGLYASDPADMAVGLSLGPLLRELGVRRSLLLAILRRSGTVAAPRACSFTDGLQTLADALFERHRSAVRLGAPVRSLAPRPHDGWTIELDAESVPAERVVLTCPAPAVAAILESAAPEAAARLRQLRYNPLAVVQLHAGRSLPAFGFQTGLAEDLATLGVTSNDALFGRDGVHTAFLGGAWNPDLVDEPDDRLGALAAGEFERVTGSPARPMAVARTRVPAWDVSWAALQGLTLPPGVSVAANWESRPGIPARLAQAIRVAESLAVLSSAP